MFNKWKISLGTGKMSNSQLLAYSNRIASMMDGNLSYPTPNPTLLNLGAAITAFSDALTAYGTTPGNRGSSLQKGVLDTARAALKTLLAELAWYCQTTTPYSKDDFLSAGWDVSNTPEPVGLLGPVNNLEQVTNSTVPSGAVKIRWKRPDGVKPGNVKSYRVMHNVTAEVTSATQMAVVTQTHYTDLAAGTRPINFYWVIPVGTAGEGLISDGVVGYPTGPVIE